MPARSKKTSSRELASEPSRHDTSLSQSDQVLIGLYRVSNGSVARVPYEELVLQAWRDFPESFSLRNHPEHPDASDIHKKIYSTLKPAGLVVSLGNKVFRLTDEGIAQAAALLNDKDSASQAHARLSREDDRLLKHALSTRALAKWESGRAEDIIDYEAQLFFQFSTGTGKQERRNRLRKMQDMAVNASRLGHPKAEALQDLTSFLADEFSVLFAEGS